MCGVDLVVSMPTAAQPNKPNFGDRYHLDSPLSIYTSVTCRWLPSCKRPLSPSVEKKNSSKLPSQCQTAVRHSCTRPLEVPDVNCAYIAFSALLERILLDRWTEALSVMSVISFWETGTTQISPAGDIIGRSLAKFRRTRKLFNLYTSDVKNKNWEQDVKSIACPCSVAFPDAVGLWISVNCFHKGWRWVNWLGQGIRVLKLSEG